MDSGYKIPYQITLVKNFLVFFNQYYSFPSYLALCWIGWKTYGGSVTYVGFEKSKKVVNEFFGIRNEVIGAWFESRLIF